MRVIILGGGPCGLGAAWRLHELGHTDWVLYEGGRNWGGLAGSEQDHEGFWWDYGGHVLFSHYPYFDRLMAELLGDSDGWVLHRRESWIWIQNRFVSYPLQQNIRHLPKEVLWPCLQGLLDIHHVPSAAPPRHFDEWIEANFGRGLADCFMRPYNRKVWAHPLEEMDWNWIGERVAPTNLAAVLRNLIFEKDERSWGPNAQFRFPRLGGTGSIWRALAARLPENQRSLGKKAVRLDPAKRTLLFEDGTMDGYDRLISSIPLDGLLAMIDGNSGLPGGNELIHTATHVVGLALTGNPPEKLADKCWMYFPEDDCPFYRATVFSNYSPNNIPDADRFWSLLLEVSENTKPAGDVPLPEKMTDSVIQGAINTHLINDRSSIHHIWHRRLPYGYPVPTVGRNAVLFPLLRQFENHGIYSRGRFGAWRYEVGNMDHSLMQGVECVNGLFDVGEELTLWYPAMVNAPHPSGSRR
ncbi:putative flavin-containing amine oxidoreductase family protein [uncultured Desulfatiglans sp.]|nr:putative flavin-containing amine oxidoreductase family protein [uncultured Desulfatiglans sp.]